MRRPLIWRQRACLNSGVSLKGSHTRPLQGRCPALRSFHSNYLTSAFNINKKHFTIHKKACPGAEAGTRNINQSLLAPDTLGITLYFLCPGLLHHLIDILRDRHIVQSLCHSSAVPVRPVKELQDIFGLGALFRALRHEYEGGSCDGPCLLACLFGKYHSKAGRALPVGGLS